MSSKKQKDKKKKIQEMQTRKKTGSLEAMQVSSLRQRLSKLDEQRRVDGQELRSLRQEKQLLERSVSELERKLKGQEKLTSDMHNNHTLMRKSLAEIRDMHFPRAVTRPDGTTFQVCETCRGIAWPCRTYSIIQMPEQVAITGLLMIEQDLTKEE